MSKRIEVELPENTAEDLKACCRKFGLDFHLFVQRAIETKLAGLADEGANWRDSAHSDMSYAVSSAVGTARSDEEE